MKIKEFLKESYVDYPKKISTVVFTPSCNYKCPACHAKYLLEGGKNVKDQEFFDYLDSRLDWIDAVVLCGGEPTLEKDLIEFTKKIKDRNIKTKLDTNGSNPRVLMELLNKKLIDYVAMDVKGPKNLYDKLVGKKADIEDIERSMKLAQNFPSYEFRTTVVLIIRNKNETSFMDVEEAEETAKWIVEVTGKNKHKYYLQEFVPRKEGLLDSRLEKFPETPKDLLREMKEKIIKCLPNCEIRNED